MDVVRLVVELEEDAPVPLVPGGYIRKNATESRRPSAAARLLTSGPLSDQCKSRMTSSLRTPPRRSAIDDRGVAARARTESPRARNLGFSAMRTTFAFQPAMSWYRPRTADLRSGSTRARAGRPRETGADCGRRRRSSCQKRCSRLSRAVGPQRPGPVPASESTGLPLAAPLEIPLGRRSKTPYQNRRRPRYLRLHRSDRTAIATTKTRQVTEPAARACDHWTSTSEAQIAASGNAARPEPRRARWQRLLRRGVR